MLDSPGSKAPGTEQYQVIPLILCCVVVPIRMQAPCPEEALVVWKNKTNHIVSSLLNASWECLSPGGLSLLYFTSTHHPCRSCPHGVSLSPWSPKIKHSKPHTPSRWEWKIFLRVIWGEKASSCLPVLFSHLQGRTMKKRKATPDSWGCWVFFFPLFFFFLKKIHWGTEIEATRALALFVEARSTNDHLYSWHHPGHQLEASPGYPCPEWTACHLEEPPRISWWRPTCLSCVSRRVFCNMLFFISPNKTWKPTFQAWDLRLHCVCKRPRRHRFRDLEVLLSREADTHRTWGCPQVKVTYKHFYKL